VRQAGKRKYRLRELPGSRAQLRGEMLTGRHVIGLAQQTEN